MKLLGLEIKRIRTAKRRGPRKLINALELRRMAMRRSSRMRIDPGYVPFLDSVVRGLVKQHMDICGDALRSDLLRIAVVNGSITTGAIDGEASLPEPPCETQPAGDQIVAGACTDATDSGCDTPGSVEDDPARG